MRMSTILNAVWNIHTGSLKFSHKNWLMCLLFLFAKKTLFIRNYCVNLTVSSAFVLDIYRLSEHGSSLMGVRTSYRWMSNCCINNMTPYRHKEYEECNKVLNALFFIFIFVSLLFSHHSIVWSVVVFCLATFLWNHKNVDLMTTTVPFEDIRMWDVWSNLMEY